MDLSLIIIVWRRINRWSNESRSTPSTPHLKLSWRGFLVALHFSRKADGLIHSLSSHEPGTSGSGGYRNSISDFSTTKSQEVV
jgi:hypothetical protein